MTHLGPQSHREPLPPVDGKDRERRRHDLLRGDDLGRLLNKLIRSSRTRWQGQRLAPSERCALTRHEERELFPRGHKVHAGIELTKRAGVLGVHLKAVCAAVKLGGTLRDRLEKERLKRAGMDGLLEPKHLVEDRGKRLAVNDSQLLSSGLHCAIRAANRAPFS